jgi:hypothetical protein
MSKEKIEIPKYVLEGNKNIPEDLKKVFDYFRDCGNKNYELCLVGEKESVAKDLKEIGYQGKEFIHLDNQSLKTMYPFFPVKVKNSIIRTNRLISNPDNDFNQSKSGVHTLGLAPISEIKALNDLGYGLTSWNGIYVYNKCSVFCVTIGIPDGQTRSLVDGLSGDDNISLPVSDGVLHVV